MLRGMVATVLCVALLGCASAEHRALLASFERACAAGDKSSCDTIPYQRAVNQDEAVNNALAGAALVVLVPLVVLGEVAQARQDAGICGWGKHTYAC
jgi:hypothetical protein